MKYAVIAFTVFLITLRSLLMKAASDRDHSLPQILVIFTTAAGTSILTALARGFSLHGSTVVIALAFGVCNFLSQYLTKEAQGGIVVGNTHNDNRQSIQQNSSVNLTGNSFYVRSDQDIHDLAVEIATLTRTQQRGRGLRMA